MRSRAKPRLLAGAALTLVLAVTGGLLGGPASAAPEGVPAAKPGTSEAWGDVYSDFGDPLAGVTTVAIAGKHILGLRSDGTVVGQGDTSGSLLPVPVELTRGTGTVTAIAAGTYFSMALKADGTVVLWGDGAADDPSLSSGASTLRDITGISAGNTHALALRSDGTVAAWGANDFGQTDVPTGLSGVVAVSAGYYHSLALKGDGTVVAWGAVDPAFNFGQVTVPAGLNDVVQISAGGMHSVAVKRNGTVVSWGTPLGGVTASGTLRNVVAVAAGYSHSVALRSDGTAVEWGHSWASQTKVPTWVGSSAIAVSAGWHSSAVVHTTTKPVPVLKSAEPVVVRDGDSLSVDISQWDSWATFSYQWTRDGAPDTRSATDTLAVTADDRGRVFTVTITASNPGYETVSRTSKPLSVGELLRVTPAPTISGTPSAGEVLTAAPGTWEPAPVTLSYQWLREGVAIAGATQPAYRVVAADADKAISVKVIGAKSGYDTAATVSGTVQIMSLLTAAPVPTVAGTPRAGETLHATSGTWSPAPVELSYQWMRNGVPISGATTPSLTLTAADSGAAITVAVTGRKSGYGTTVKLSKTLNVESSLTSAPIPVITGTMRVGQTVTAMGSWAPAPVTLSYRWLRDGVTITGATRASYALTAADAGAHLTVVVTGSKAGFTTVQRSSEPVRIDETLSATPVPTVSGAPRAGELLTAAAGDWAPTPVALSYQWRRGGAAIEGATSSTYLLTQSDAGAAITVAVTGTKTGFGTVTKTSVARTIERPLTATPVPTVAGNTRSGQTLTVKPGSWGPAKVTLSYRWMRDDVAITGATGSTYRLTPADAGALVTVAVTGKRAGFTTTERISTALQIDSILTATPPPTVNGALRAGEILTASAGVWGPEPVALSYQWQRGGKAIDGATASTYLLTPADAGKVLTVAVTGSKPGFTSVTKSSASRTIERPLTLTPAPTLTGAARAGAVLAARVGAWGPATVTRSFQWKRDGVVIVGATKPNYTVTATDAGTLLSLSVTGKKAGYTTTEKSSAAVRIDQALTATPTPTVTGAPRAGAQLTATAGVWGPDTVTLAYQWRRGGAAIGGATKPNYTLTATDAGTAISVSVTGSTVGYTTVTKASAALMIERSLTASPVPKITGSARLGSTVTASTGTWGPSGVVRSYQWLRGGLPISGATAAGYKLGMADLGKPVAVRVTGSKSGYTTVERTSAPILMQ